MIPEGVEICVESFRGLEDVQTRSGKAQFPHPEDPAPESPKIGSFLRGKRVPVHRTHLVDINFRGKGQDLFRGDQHVFFGDPNKIPPAGDPKEIGDNAPAPRYPKGKGAHLVDHGYRWVNRFQPPETFPEFAYQVPGLVLLVKDPSQSQDLLQQSGKGARIVSKYRDTQTPDGLVRKGPAGTHDHQIRAKGPNKFEVGSQM